MRKPIVGVIGNAHSIDDILSVQHVGEHSLLCISEVADALPLMFAGCPAITDIDALLDTVDGILLTGARATYIRPVSASTLMSGTSLTTVIAML